MAYFTWSTPWYNMIFLVGVMCVDSFNHPSDASSLLNSLLRRYRDVENHYITSESVLFSLWSLTLYFSTETS